LTLTARGLPPGQRHRSPRNHDCPPAYVAVCGACRVPPRNRATPLASRASESRRDGLVCLFGRFGGDTLGAGVGRFDDVPRAAGAGCEGPQADRGSSRAATPCGAGLERLAPKPHLSAGRKGVGLCVRLQRGKSCGDSDEDWREGWSDRDRGGVAAVPGLRIPAARNRTLRAGGLYRSFLGGQIPSSKLQIPTDSQVPNPNPTPNPIPNRLGVDLGIGLGVGTWGCVGAWDLELGI
jgi:hypothetical protein